MGLEVERKYLHVDLQNLRKILADNGAHCLGAHFESNWVFDTAEKRLMFDGRLLRLRCQEWKEKTRHLVTLKLPCVEQYGFKAREERETEVTDGRALHKIFEGLGYVVAARYEKVRESWRIDAVAVDLDVLPFADVVELEGRADDITSVQRRLKLDNAEISIKTYHELHQIWLRQNNKPALLSFVFTETQRAEWRKKLGLPEQTTEAQASQRRG